jgi:hypothetical protein
MYSVNSTILQKLQDPGILDVQIIWKIIVIQGRIQIAKTGEFPSFDG